MSTYFDSVFEPAPVSAKKIETEVEIGVFHPFLSVFIPTHNRPKCTLETFFGVNSPV
jgi:hypothetical protein